ncbi:MAG: hypothetical protein GY774_40030 [Planctomycetes bacterium]|nr:hypothetical protein [Planctomycetota bacterium]
MSEYFIAVKVTDDWELEVLAIPFGDRDSDGQWFDDRTDIMGEAFSTPLAIYQHGIKQGAEALDDKPIVIGHTKPGSLQMKVDGWHIRLVLNKALKVAKDIMKAAKDGLVAVSSDSIAHLARLDIGGKLIQYEKNRPGRIAVWPLAGVSLWERGGGNALPASNATYALPAMKAIYRDAEMQFPELEDEQNGGVQTDETVQRRAKVIAKSNEILRKSRYL